MPYIKSYHRTNINLFHKGEQCTDAGELNFAITTLISGFLDCQGMSYSDLNAAMGALECAKLELYRRVAAPYEDCKINENGDVYPESLTK